MKLGKILALSLLTFSLARLAHGDDFKHNVVLKEGEIAFMMDDDGGKSHLGSLYHSIEQARSVIYPGSGQGYWYIIGHDDKKSKEHKGSIIFFVSEESIETKIRQVSVNADLTKEVEFRVLVEGYSEISIKLHQGYRVYTATLKPSVE